MTSRALGAAVGLALLATVAGAGTPARASVVAYAAAGGDFLAVDDAGRVWLWDEPCPAWHLLDAAFPDTRCLSFVRNSSGSFIGAIATGEALTVVQWVPATRTFGTMATWTLPTTDVAEVALVDHGGPFWIRTSTGAIWLGRFVGSTFTWFGPCEGPSGPVAAEQHSWGSIKAQHR